MSNATLIQNEFDSLMAELNYLINFLAKFRNE